MPLAVRRALVILATLLAAAVPAGRLRAQAEPTGAGANDEVPASAASPGADEAPPAVEAGGAATVEAGATLGDMLDADAGATAGADGAPAATPVASKPRAVRPWAWNSLRGSVGGFRLVDARSGAPGTFRLQLHTEFFSASDYLVSGDENSRTAGALSLSVAITRFLEAYASVWTYANSNTKGDPELFQALGDGVFGLKGYATLAPWLTVGGDLEVELMNGVGGLGYELAATGAALRLAATADLRHVGARGIPLLARFNVGYKLDNSSNLIEDSEDDRYAALPDPLARNNETRHLVTRIERFALGVNRTDMVNVGLGFEAPFELGKDWVLSPLAEWTWGLPVNRQDYNCLFVFDPDDPSEPVAGDDGCLDRQGVSAFPMDLTFGLRVAPPVEGLLLFGGVDVGVTGTSTFVRELSPNAPYQVLLGLSYAYDTARRSAPPAPPPPVVARWEPAEAGHWIRGQVVSRGGTPAEPVVGATLAYAGANSGLTGLVTDAEGRFADYAFVQGEAVELSVTHPDHAPGSCTVALDVEGAAATLCVLEPLPRTGSIALKVVDEAGSPLALPLVYTGPSSGTLSSDVNGEARLGDLSPGRYRIESSNDGFLVRSVAVEVVARQAASAELRLTRRAAKPLAELDDDAIRIRKQITFATNSDEITAASFPVLDEVADVLFRNPEIALIEVQGHTDNTGSAEANKSLSARRADKVRRALVERGVAGSRIDATGYGMERPLVPNITTANRAKNRRVEFLVQRRQ